MLESENFFVAEATVEIIDELTYLFDAYRVFYEQKSDLEGAKLFLQERLKEDSAILVAVYSKTERLAGFCQLFPSLSSVSMCEIYILNDVFVLEEYRRSGVGSLLMDAAVSFALNRGVKRLKLQTAYDNLAAMRLYERCGWKKGDFHTYSFTND
ncbi:MAG: GNAT family N-acetyltransferase [Hormoscilla sp. GM7CHS1pb]|nr:GNAT family N-acetyltransferase [Hormoscilla sp. GM7CHS1pb]